MKPPFFLPSWCWGGLLLLTLSLLGVGPSFAAEPTRDAGVPFMQHFTPLDYHANTQCGCIVQDARGVLYVGNYALVLEYDGSTWRKLPTGKRGWVDALAYDS